MYRDERPKGFDPVNDPLDPLFNSLAYTWRRMGIENALDLLTCLLETL
jgi:hypothetical protein